jgi:hypothetical protein
MGDSPLEAIANRGRNCAHQECHCPAPLQSPYCSEDCEQAGTKDDMGPCPCKHPECINRLSNPT